MAAVHSCRHCGNTVEAVNPIGTVDAVCPRCGGTLGDVASASPAAGFDASAGPGPGTRLVVVVGLFASAAFIALYGLVLYGVVALLYKRFAKERLPAGKNWVAWELTASALVVLVLFAIGGNALFQMQPQLKPSADVALPTVLLICAVFYVAFSFVEWVFAAIQLARYRRVHFGDNPTGRQHLAKSLFIGCFLTNFVLVLLPLGIAIASGKVFL